MKLKDKRIRIIKIVPATSKTEGRLKEYHPQTGKLWAYFRHMSAREYYSAAAIQAEEEVIFIINWRNDINTSNVVEYKGHYYNITRIDDFEGDKTDLTLYAKHNKAMEGITVIEDQEG